MPELFRREDDALVGSVTEEDLEFLVDALVEEDSEDTDYYIDLNTLDYLKDRGAPADLLVLLKGALGDREGVEIYYPGEPVEDA